MKENGAYVIYAGKDVTILIREKQTEQLSAGIDIRLLIMLFLSAREVFTAGQM